MLLLSLVVWRRINPSKPLWSSQACCISPQALWRRSPSDVIISPLTFMPLWSFDISVFSTENKNLSQWRTEMLRPVFGIFGYLSREGSLSWHNCFDTGARFCGLILLSPKSRCTGNLISTGMYPITLSRLRKNRSLAKEYIQFQWSYDTCNIDKTVTKTRAFSLDYTATNFEFWKLTCWKLIISNEW